MINLQKNRLLKLSLIVIWLFLTILPILHTNSETDTNINPIVEVKEPISNKDLLWKIGYEKGLSQQTLIQIEKVVFCESSWDSNAIGDNGNSFGLVQIYLPANPTITKEQALNPVFALNFITDEFLKGHQNRWSCYKILY